MNDPLYIYIHIPKTAGTSLKENIQRTLSKDKCIMLYGKSITSEQIILSINKLTQKQKENIRYIGGHQVWYGIHSLFPDREVRYITFLRNPVQRVISNYFKILRTPTHDLHKTLINDQDSFQNFIQGKHTSVVFNHMTVFLGRDFVDPNHNELLCRPGSLPDQFLKQAIVNLRNFYFVGFQESYNEDLHKLAQLTGLFKADNTIWMNKSNGIVQREISIDDIEKIMLNNWSDELLYRFAKLHLNRNG